MIISSLIIAVSVVLFFYWFRYTCVLILNTRTTRDYSEGIAAANNLGFVDVQGRLNSSTIQEMDSLQVSLQRDFRVVDNLLKKAADLQVGGDSLEEVMLRIDFRAMQACYGLSRGFSESGARMALGEMTQIIAHFANTCGERAAASTEA
jgi:hypothetical protein